MKNKSIILAASRIALGAITLLAIAVQLISSIHHGRDLDKFFSFFTIQSNLLAAFLFIAFGITQLLNRPVKGAAYFRGAITLYMAMTGIIYVLFLSGDELALQTTIPVVNIVLHYIIPVAIILDWIFFPPKERLSLRIALLWLIYPLVYLVCSLIRGGITGWYPYPFLNTVINGWPNVIGMSLTLAVGIVILTALLTLRTSNNPRVRAS